MKHPTGNSRVKGSTFTHSSLIFLRKKHRMRKFCFLVTDLFSLCSSSSREVFLGNFVLEICTKFTGVTLRYGYSSVNLRYIFTRSFPKKTSGGRLLSVIILYFLSLWSYYKFNWFCHQDFLKVYSTELRVCDVIVSCIFFLFKGSNYIK